MRHKIFLLSFFIFLFSFSVFAESNAELARRAISENPEEARAAINALRLKGQNGLDGLFEVYEEEIQRFNSTGLSTAEWNRIAFALDHVAMQKNAYSAGLFWHTDFEEAQKLSKETGKPILALRLLGNLNEEFSCANSRFFRAVLYPNEKISKYLRENYILHWKSVRPAPRITVDFGDGRKIERTITGNSIHYVLDENGNVVNALPGLYSPERFYQFLTASAFWIRQAEEFESGKWKPLAVAPEIKDKRQAVYRDLRFREYNGLRRQINAAINSQKIKFDSNLKPWREFEEMPTAIEVAPLAITKMSTEIVFLKDLTPDVTRYGAGQIDLEKWQRIAGVYKLLDKLDQKSVEFIRTQLGKTDLNNDRFAKLIANFENLVGVDSVRNDFLLRPTLLVWLNQDMDKDVEALNKKVYDELFLTSDSDQWLGLYSADVYTALDGNGIRR